MFIHPLADVQSKRIGEGTKVWQFAIILKEAVIGCDCNINCHTFIENDVQIGDRVTLKSGVYVWDGIQIRSDAFIGPNVTFTNDKYPRSKHYPPQFQQTIIGQGASIGANATILGGVFVGEFALVGAGSVVTKDVAPYTLVQGNPARAVGRVNKEGVIVERFELAAIKK
jgi:UDP-2-acetamido-3-amino-2,3-dideoxy-glucuronate N-acetyltransferase